MLLLETICSRFDFIVRYLAIKFQEMEAKLLEEKLEKEKEDAEEKEKEVAKGEATGSDQHVPQVNEKQNEVEEVSSESVDKRIEVENFSTDDGISYTPGPIRVPTEELPEADASELPPIPQTSFVEQERLEMVEINNDGTSGHLSHSIE